MLNNVQLILFGLLISIGFICPHYSLAADANSIEVADPRMESTDKESDIEKELIQVPAEPSEATKKRRFDSFVPSEQISADNAVPFPVDI